MSRNRRRGGGVWGRHLQFTIPTTPLLACLSAYLLLSRVSHKPPSLGTAKLQPPLKSVNFVPVFLPISRYLLCIQWRYNWTVIQHGIVFRSTTLYLCNICSYISNHHNKFIIFHHSYTIFLFWWKYLSVSNFQIWNRTFLTIADTAHHIQDGYLPEGSLSLDASSCMLSAYL